MPHEPLSPAPVELRVSWATLGKLGAAALLAWMLIRLWPLLLLVFLALLVAVTLWPVLRWTRARGWPKWSGVLLAALLIAALVAGFLVLVIPALTNQVASIIENLPKFQENFAGRLPQSGPLREAANRLMESASFSNPEPLMKRSLAWGRVALEGLAQFGVMLVVAVYLLADGERVYQWLTAFLPRRQRAKVAEAAPELASVVSAYMAGQLITSLLCAGYVFAMLSVLHVPNAVLLATLAGVFDILPIVGFFLAVLPAMGVALSVGPGTALLVLVLYTAYHLAENYFIVPKVYGNRLRLSTLTVLVACLAGALLAGILGAILVLPVVASYPIIERIWLRPLLEPDTVARHEAIDEREHPSS